MSIFCLLEIYLHETNYPMPEACKLPITHLAILTQNGLRRNPFWRLSLNQQAAEAFHELPLNRGESKM